jgi:cobalt-zinc-cadmium efflux system outer membrane protein
VLCFGAALALFAGHARADSAAVWTLESALRVGFERSPRIRSATAARDTALAYRTFSRMPRARNPLIGLRALVGRPDDPAATYALTLGLPFDVAGRRRAWRDEARFVVGESEALLAAARNDVHAEVRAAYTQLAVAEASRALAEEAVRTARELFDRMAVRVEASASTALDLSLAESQLGEAEAELERAARALVEAQGRFRLQLDLAPDAPVAVEPLPRPALPDGLSVEGAVRRAGSMRHEPSAWVSSHKRWQAADRRLRAEALAPMTAAFEAERQGNRRPNSSVGASVTFELPLLQTNQGERAVAHQQARAAALSGELTEHAIVHEVTTSFRALESALAELSALDGRAIPAAERTLQQVRTLLDSGAIDSFRLLTAQRGAYELRRRRIEAFEQAWLARIALERAVGGWETSP